ncbi:unnamed protein product [Didymodactylos carnosus]|uniref:HEAT repeat domain-containing protein n=1 Tax=Didymodactylos carnosus TaxID=1234261 RepID=A0A815SWC0_9BILA|nr:unnamed protein product [Didymodactylos carnosus]CAF1495313.1 unnamed protein product [Didymodactylos carnosus]CAF3834412.1 unnamed protein product [Didymodactylos carnosus]CAF4357860.1 unnamed protein product [Didymodactylos carnosus]
MSRLPTRDAARLCRNTQDIDTILALTNHVDPVVRQRALKEIRPCRVKDDIDIFWARVLEMIDDPANNVREQVLHTLCDGSPDHMEMQVLVALEIFNRDPDAYIRRRAHKVLSAYRRSGKWNIL